MSAQVKMNHLNLHFVNSTFLNIRFKHIFKRSIKKIDIYIEPFTFEKLKQSI
jgi:hypothetical protein